jgi:hypothetical protein
MPNISTRPTADELKATYPEGCVVRVKQDKLDNWTSDTASRMRDRLGLVSSHTFPHANLILVFPAIGRRKEHRQQISYPERYVDVVTDAEVLAAWRAEVDKTAARKAKNQR